MIEFTREQFDYSPIPFTVVSNQDHRTPVLGAPLGQYYVAKTSISGLVFKSGKGVIVEVGHGSYNLYLDHGELVVGPVLISIPGLNAGSGGYDSVSLRIICVPAIEVAQANQEDAYLMTFLMMWSQDHVSPLPHLHPVVTVSMAGSSFVTTYTGATDLGFGFYNIVVPTYPENPTGEFNNQCVYLIKAVADNADITYDAFHVFRYDYPA